MSPLIRNVAKTAVLFCATGILLALLAPVMAPALGFTATWAATAYPVLWTGAFFGAFGAISSALGPLCDGLMGEKKTLPPLPALNGTLGNEMERQRSAMFQPELTQATANHTARLAAAREQSNLQRTI